VQVVKSSAGAYDAFEAFDSSFDAMLREIGIEDPWTACRAQLVRGFNGEPYAVARREDVRRALHDVARSAGVTFRVAADAAPDARWILDATGRTALHTAVVRTEPAVAYLFEAMPTDELAERHDAFGWGYRLGDARGSTVGVIVTKPYADVNAARAWAERTFGIAVSADARPVRRAAHAQRCTTAINGNRIAVGDAAIAQDPLTGAGQRFALASALAAVATIRTSVEAPMREEIAHLFYADMIARSARRRPRDASLETAQVADLSQIYVFAGRVERGGILRDDLVVEDDVVEWDGVRARWSAGVDLLWLAEAAAVPSVGWHVVDRFVRRGAHHDRAVAVVAAAVGRGLLRRASP
jgi:hypothetical protein